MRKRKNRIIRFDALDEPMVISKAIMDLLLSTDRSAEVIALYCFYYYTAKWQRTTAPQSTTLYSAKALGWGKDKLIGIKNILKEMGLVEDIQSRDLVSKKITGHFIKIIINPQSHPPCFPLSGKSDRNKREKNTNTLKKSTKKDFIQYFPEEWKTNENFKNVLNDFEMMRDQRVDTVFTPTAKNNMAMKLKRYSLPIVIEALKISYQHNWLGVFPEKVKLKDVPKVELVKQTPFEIFVNTYGDSSYCKMVIKDVYQPAAELFETDPGVLSTLARNLITMLKVVKVTQTDKAKKDEVVPDPITIVVAYVDWLAKQKWVTDYNVSQFTISNTLFNNYFLKSINRSVGKHIFTGEL